MEAKIARSRAKFTVAAIAVLTAVSMQALPAGAARARTAYVPGISIVPDVLQPDGSTPRTYQTPAGPSYWTQDLPIQRGDKIKLNIFVATGGADLRRMVVRLDNAKIADLAASPWDTIIDTSTLRPGYHMVEAWAEGTGDKPQSSTKTLSFYVVDALPATYAVKSSEELIDKNAIGAATPEASTDASSFVPSFLANRPVDPGAAVVIRSTQSSVDQMLADQSGTVTLPQPVLLYVQPAPGSSAIRYAYALIRDGQVVAASTAPASLQYERLRLRPRTESTPGLRPGPVTLVMWGIDQIGRPSNPVRRDIVIGEEGARQ